MEGLGPFKGVGLWVQGYELVGKPPELGLFD